MQKFAKKVRRLLGEDLAGMNVVYTAPDYIVWIWSISVETDEGDRFYREHNSLARCQADILTQIKEWKKGGGE